MTSKQLIKAVDDYLLGEKVHEKDIKPEVVAEWIQENNVLFRRHKLDLLLKLVTPVLQRKNSSKGTNTNGMNKCMHQLYQTTTCMIKDDTDEVKMKPLSLNCYDTIINDKKKKFVESGNMKPRKKEKRKSHQEMENDVPIVSKSLFPEEKIPPFNLTTLGGIDKVIEEIKNLIIRPLKYPEVYKHVGVYPPRGVLIHGPPGSGKTKLALAIAGEANVPFFKVSAPELITSLSGDSEQHIRDLFSSAKNASPCLVFIDEIDILCPKRENAGREMERRIVAQLGTCMDDLGESFVIVMGATNRIDALDPMIRRNGRFDKEIAMGIPDEAARIHILKNLTLSLRLDASVDFRQLGRMTPGFVGADLESVIKEAALLCINRTFYQSNCQINLSEMDTQTLNQFAVSHDDFVKAIFQLQPSAKREGFATCPDVSWDDVGGLGEERKELENQICYPIREPKLYERLGISVPAGILLYGPPGCGKTLLAKAVASESGANFISVKGPELLNKYLGESERAIRQVFQRARVSSPCVIFFDELDSLCSRRGQNGHPASERVVNQLLTEMDGVENRHLVFVVAATNRPELIDPAMLRPGRLDRLIYIPLPNTEKRVDILRRLSRKTPIEPTVDLNYVATLLEGFSGADLSAVLRQAVLFLLEDYRATRQKSYDDLDEDFESQSKLKLQMNHLLKAVGTVVPSVTNEHRLHYDQINRTLAPLKKNFF